MKASGGLLGSMMGAVAVLFLACGAASAQGSNPMLKVKERAKYLNDYKALLEHSDPSMRLAAIQEALDGDDEALRTMALDTALGSDDERLQTAALRWIFRERNRLVIDFILPDEPQPAQQHTYQIWHGLVIKELTINEKTGEISAGNHYFEGGQLVRGGFEMSWDRGASCVFRASVSSPTLLTGSVTCTYGPRAAEEIGATRASIPLKISLF